MVDPNEYDGYSQIAVNIEDRIATLKFNRPEILNAMSHATMDELSRAWLQLDQDAGVAAVILTGAGKKFSAGADYQAIKSGDSWANPFDRDPFAHVLRRMQGQLSLRVPLIAAVNGDAIGGAATVALLCDAVIMDETARIGDPHVRAGVPAGDGGNIIWTLLVGPIRAKHYLMTGDLLSAVEAERIGLVSEVVPEGTAYDRAMVLARRYRDDLAPLAVKWTKYSVNKIIRQWMNESFESALALELVAFLSEDRKEAIDAFLEKRPPKFQGR